MQQLPSVPGSQLCLAPHNTSAGAACKTTCHNRQLCIPAYSCAWLQAMVMLCGTADVSATQPSSRAQVYTCSPYALRVKSARLNCIWFQPSSKRMGMVQMNGLTRVVLCRHSRQAQERLS